MQLRKRSLKKKFRASTGFEPVTSANTGAMLYQLSYEVISVGSIFPMKEIEERINEIILHNKTLSHITFRTDHELSYNYG